MTGERLKVLVVDDNAIDIELAVHALRRGGLVVDAMAATNEAELRAVLEHFVPDVVLCDFAFPGFDGFIAQRVVREFYADTPLIFVSGTISESHAVRALQSGAVDYVMKSNLIRLPAAVSRAVGDARDRAAMVKSLQRSEAYARGHAQRLESLWNIVNEADLRDAELWDAMLEQAGERIRAGRRYQGVLWRVEGDSLVIEATCAGAANALESDVSTGGRLVLADTIVGAFLESGRTVQSWDDVQVSDVYRSVVRTRAIRSFMTTRFTVGGVIWGLSFASREATTDEPLDAQDEAYVGILAAFFANRVQQRWQFDRIQYQQTHDVLTGLLNRAQFRLRARLAAGSLASFVIVLVDVNAFNEINTRYGYMTGDALLVEIGAALTLAAGPGSIVGRIAGNSFGVFLVEPGSPEAVLESAYRVAHAFSSGFSTGDREGREFVALTASIGVASSPTDGTTFDEVLARAEAALGAAKSGGHNRIVAYAAGMLDDAERRATLRTEIAEALANDQFTLYFQPHLELATGEVSGCEALIRWNHPVRGLLAPLAFIPFAEATGLIVEIDAWVMQRVCSIANALAQGRPNFRVYFNLSGRQAGNFDLIRTFVRAARNGVALEHIGVEVTESDVMRDVDATRRVCRGLRRLGVKVAIDDFGTGYSSLAMLQRLPVDVVKIDRAFVSGVLDDEHDGALTEAIIALSDRFGFASLGEGAERLEEVEWLRERSCTYVQGYALAAPMPYDAFRAWIADREAAPSPAT